MNFNRVNKFIVFFLLFITAQCLTQNNDFTILPSPIIGWDSLQNKFTYPEIARRAVLWGAYDVVVLIDSTGKLIDIDIIGANYQPNYSKDKFTSQDSLFISHIKYVFRDLKWNPGSISNKPKTMKLIIPIVYYLSNRRNSSPTLFFKSNPAYPN